MREHRVLDCTHAYPGDQTWATRYDDGELTATSIP